MNLLHPLSFEVFLPYNIEIYILGLEHIPAW